MNNVDLTVLIITKNEEKNLPKALNSIKDIAIRIVIVDSYSEDKTVEIARSFGCDVYFHEFESHYKQINWGLNNTNINTEWVMRLDADEEILPELAKEIKEKLSKLDNNIEGIYLKRRTYFMGKWIKHGGVYPTWLLRIFRNGKGKSEEKNMDEHIIVKGKTIKFKNDFIDKNNKNLYYWINKHNWYSTREIYSILNDEGDLKANIFGVLPERKRWIKKNIYLKLPYDFRAWVYYIYRMYFKLGFLDRKEGKIFHFLQAYWHQFLIGAKLYEFEKGKITIKEIEELIFKSL